MKKLIASLSLCSSFIATLALAASPVAATKPQVPTLVDFALPNGLRVLLLPRPGAPSVAVQVFYHAGSKDEPEARRGIAHLFEHMMFKGSTRVPPEAHARYLNQLGGDSNAFTTDDVTAYENTVPPAALDFTLALEADRMHGLKVTQALLDSEREVVKEELRMRFENSPVAEGVRRMISLAFTKHPYKVMAIGTKEMLDAVTVEDCKKFYDMFYRPNNATLVIVGAATEADVRRLVGKHFDSLPRGPTVTRRVVEEPAQTAARSETVPLQMALPLVLGAYHIPAAVNADLYALKVLNEILSDGESSRLHQRLVRSGLAVFSGGAMFDMEEAGLYVTYAQVNNNTAEDVKKCNAAIEAELARFTKDKVSAAELKKAKNKLATKALFERTHAGGLATALGMAALVQGDPMTPFHDVEHYDAVTPEQILAVAKKYLVATNRTSLSLLPRASTAAVAEAQVKKQAVPPTPPSPENPKLQPLQPPRDLPAPQIQFGEVIRETLPNGLRLLLVPRHDLPLVEAKLFVNAGNLDSQIERMGVAEITAGALRKGAGKRNALQIANTIEGAGAALSTEVDEENMGLGIAARSGDLPLALSLLADLSMRPTFPEQELKETFDAILAEHVHDLRDSPGQLAMVHAQNLYYGDQDPRGRPVSERSIRGITRADLLRFHAERYRPDGALLVVSGDIELAQVKSLLQKPGGLATWKSRGSLIEADRPSHGREPFKVRLIDKPEATQTSLVLEGTGLAHASPALPAFSVADYVLGGGGFSSRLEQVVRSEGGKTYGIHSAYSRSRWPGTFTISTNTRVAETGRTLKLILDEVKKMQKNGPTENEIEGARANLVGRVALALEAAGDVASALARATLDGLADDYLATYPARLRAVTLAEAKQAATLFQPLCLVAVGPAAIIKPLLEATGMHVDEVVPFDAPIAAPDRVK